MNHRGFLAVVLGLMTAAAFADDNLARSAHATASESFAGLPPEAAIDGKPETRWSGIPGHNAGVWFQLAWDAPQRVGEVVVRQFDRFVKEFDLQVSAGEGWVTIGHFGSPNEKLTRAIVCRFAPCDTRAIRLANITNGPSFTEIEVYADPQKHPTTVELASDLQGNFVGVVTDSLGASPVARERVTLTGTAWGRPWTASATSDAHGLFFVPIPLRMSGPVTVSVEGTVPKSFDSAGFQRSLTPHARGTTLDSGWEIADPRSHYDRAGQRFVKQESDWRPVSVPGHAAMSDFRTYHEEYLYRRRFDAPRGTGRLKLRFDGVYSGAKVELNGRTIATHVGGATPFEVDVTDTVKPKDNLLIVFVTEHTLVSDELDKMSQYADFPLAGIMRKVELFRTPDVHVERYRVDSRVAADGQTVAHLVANVVNEGDQPANAAIRAKFHGRDLGERGAGDLAPGATRVVEWEVAESGVPTWTAESPNLLDLDFTVGGGFLHQKVGLRETAIVGTKILVNGRPVKFRGACHHDSHPMMGRAVTPELERQDVALFKEANLNALRTSHYPPLPELLDETDRQGLYVEDEASFCWVSVADDLRNTPRIIQLTGELIERDRNHPSVTFWSLCNESEFGYGFERSHEFARRVDPSRPTSAATSAWTEIATLHNPISSPRIRQNERIDLPLLFDESLCIFQGIFNDVAEMWVDPGIRDYYAEPLGAVYRDFMASSVTQGSMIWAWSDDLFLVPGRGYEYGRGTTKSHFAEPAYTVPGRGIVGDAPWGVVDGWRRRKPEFWHVQKQHSPVKIDEKAAKFANGVWTAPIENQFDFTNLSDLRVVCRGGRVDPITLAPHEKGTVRVLGRPTGVELQFWSRDGRLIDACQFGAVARPDHDDPWLQSIKPALEHQLAGDAFVMSFPDGRVSLDSGSGMLRGASFGGRVSLLEAPHLHVLSADDPTRPLPDDRTWKNTSSLEIHHYTEDLDYELSGAYEHFTGSYQVEWEVPSTVRVKADFVYDGPDFYAREVGLRFSVPRDFVRLEWERKGEWGVYPPDHIGRAKGTAFAFPPAKPVSERPWGEDPSPMGSNDFRSTKRDVTWAKIAYADGVGIEIGGARSIRAAVLTDRVEVYVNDFYGGTNVGWGEWTSNYGRGRLIRKGDHIKVSCHLRL